MEDNRYVLKPQLSNRIRRFAAVLVSILLLLSLIILVLVGVHSLTAVAAAFTVFALAIIIVLGILGISKMLCCYACDGPVGNFWYMTPSDASLVANSIPGSTRMSTVEIPYPDSTDLPVWDSENQQQHPPDYFAVTGYSTKNVEDRSCSGQETPPPSYKFLSDAGLIVDDYENEQAAEISHHQSSVHLDNRSGSVAEEQSTSVAIIMVENKSPTQETLDYNEAPP